MNFVCPALSMISLETEGLAMFVQLSILINPSINPSPELARELKKILWNNMASAKGLFEFKTAYFARGNAGMIFVPRVLSGEL